MKNLIRISNALCWGQVVNVETASDINVLLRSPREVSFINAQAKAIACWGSKGVLVPAADAMMMKDPDLHTVIGNFLVSALTKKAINKLDLIREQCECFYTEQRVEFYNGPTAMRVMFEIVNSEASVSLQELTTYLSTTSINDYDKDVKKIFTAIMTKSCNKEVDAKSMKRT